MKRLVLSVALPLFAAAACGGEAATTPPPVPPPPPALPPPGAPPPVATAVDPLGPRPPVAQPAPFAPPVPQTYALANGLTVWLVERHALPIVAIELVVGAGSSVDPKDKGGLADVTANMLDEGAGTRGALDIARDVDRLGATLHTGANADYAWVSLTALKKNLAPAAAIMGDVVVKPTFSPVEWRRVHDLWTNDLKQRASEPSAVAHVVVLRQIHEEDPYGHPVDGTVKSAARVGLDDAKKLYADRWHPDGAVCVVVGDVTKDELDPVLNQAFGAWKRTNAIPPAPPSAPGKPALPLVTGGAGATTPSAVRVVLVDRPDAPQSVIAVARKGVAARDPSEPALARVNTPLGGSFTSRLNQDLREEHGWSYGAKSRFSWNAEPGVFSAQAAVQTAHTGEALKAMLEDMKAFAKDGPTDEEVEKSRLLVRAATVESFEEVTGAAASFAREAGVGLPPGHAAEEAKRAAAATKDDLRRLAAQHVDPTAPGTVIVVVGPRAKVLPQLEAIGLGKSVETSSPDGD